MAATGIDPAVIAVIAGIAVAVIRPRMARHLRAPALPHC